MDWCQMSVFLWWSMPNHALADLLSHRWRTGKFVFLHCFLYTPLWIPLFLWQGVDLRWLVVIFVSHLIVDTQRKPIYDLIRAFTSVKTSETLRNSIAFLVDQCLHLIIPGIIALLQ